MNVAGLVIGPILIALGLVMHANRARYVYFVVGRTSVLLIAGVIAAFAFWILHAAR